MHSQLGARMAHPIQCVDVAMQMVEERPIFKCVDEITGTAGLFKRFKCVFEGTIEERFMRLFNEKRISRGGHISHISIE